MNTVATIEAPELKKFNFLPRTYIAASIKTYRIIYRHMNKANPCKHTWAYEYRRYYYNMGGMVGTGYLMHYEHPCFDLYRVSDGDEKHYSHNNCPVCGKTGVGDEVKGTLSPDKTCDSRCTNAKGHDCECSCNGKNHGINHVV